MKDKFADILQNLQQDLKRLETVDTKKQPVENVFHHLRDEKVKSLQEAVDDIVDMINKRKKLNKDVFDDVDKIIIDLNNFIGTLGPEVTKVELINIRRKLIEIEEFKIQEKINAWKDISLLKTELRERMQELSARETRFEMLDELLKK